MAASCGTLAYAETIPAGDGCNTCTAGPNGTLTCTLLHCEQAGPPPPKHHTPKVTLALADAMAGHAAAIGFGSAADFASTSWALRRCETCSEGNSLGPDVEARLSLKLAYSTAALGACWLLERKNHHGAALAVRWSAVAVFGAATVNNVVHGIRRN